MTAESILARVNGILALSDDPTPTPTRTELEKLAADLAADVRQHIAASHGVGNAAKTISRMLNGLKKSDHRRALHYAWIDAKGRQCACDGFRAYRLNEPLPLEPRPDDAGDGIDLDKVVPTITGEYDALPLPAVADLKAHIALERAANGRGFCPLWDFGPGRPVVNAPYLLDLLSVLPDAAEIFCLRGLRGLTSPLYARSERGDAVLLPVRMTDADRAAKAQEAEAQARAAAAATILREYAAHIERDPEYAMPLDTFAELARCYQPAA